MVSHQGRGNRLRIPWRQCRQLTVDVITIGIGVADITKLKANGYYTINVSTARKMGWVSLQYCFVKLLGGVRGLYNWLCIPLYYWRTLRTRVMCVPFFFRDSLFMQRREGAWIRSRGSVKSRLRKSRRRFRSVRYVEVLKCGWYWWNRYSYLLYDCFPNISLFLISCSVVFRKLWCSCFLVELISLAITLWFRNGTWA